VLPISFIYYELFFIGIIILLILIYFIFNLFCDGSTNCIVKNKDFVYFFYFTLFFIAGFMCYTVPLFLFLIDHFFTMSINFFLFDDWI